MTNRVRTESPTLTIEADSPQTARPLTEAEAHHRRWFSGSLPSFNAPPKVVNAAIVHVGAPRAAPLSPLAGPSGPPSGDGSETSEDHRRRSSIVFTLYRLTVHQSRQQSLFAGQLPPKPEILRQAITSVIGKPTNDRPPWTLRNIKQIDATSFHLKLGREGLRRRPNVSRGDFVEDETPWAPHTDVLIDTAQELCAIAPNYELAPNTDRLSAVLAHLLTRSSVARHYSVEFQAAPIKEPREFFQQLSEAYAIKSLWVTTLRPNPSDLDKDFVEPLAQHLERIRANKAKTVFRGDAIEPNETTKRMIASTAAHGGDAGATVKDGPKSRTRPVKLSAPATLTVPREVLEKAIQRAIEALRTAYEWISTRIP